MIFNPITVENNKSNNSGIREIAAKDLIGYFEQHYCVENISSGIILIQIILTNEYGDIDTIPFIIDFSIHPNNEQGIGVFGPNDTFQLFALYDIELSEFLLHYSSGVLDISIGDYLKIGIDYNEAHIYGSWVDDEIASVKFYAIGLE